MSDIVHAMGLDVPFELGGKTYHLRQYTLANHAHLHATLRSRRESPLSKASRFLKEIPPEHHQFIIREALTAKDAVTDDDVMGYLNTPEGIAHLFMLAVIKNHPEVDSIDKAMALLEDEPLLVVVRRLMNALGMDAAKNSPAGQTTSLVEQTTSPSAA